MYSRRIWWYFSYFPQKIGFGISCKFSLGDNLHEMSKHIFYENENSSKCRLLFTHAKRQFVVAVIRIPDDQEYSLRLAFWVKISADDSLKYFLILF